MLKNNASLIIKKEIFLHKNKYTLWHDNNPEIMMMKNKKINRTTREIKNKFKKKTVETAISRDA